VAAVCLAPACDSFFPGAADCAVALAFATGLDGCCRFALALALAFAFGAALVFALAAGFDFGGDFAFVAGFALAAVLAGDAAFALDLAAVRVFVAVRFTVVDALLPARFAAGLFAPLRCRLVLAGAFLLDDGAMIRPWFLTLLDSLK
jgi:hypothetical protein